MEDEESIKNALKDSGLYEETLTRKEMLDCYKALSNSQADKDEKIIKENENEKGDIIEKTLNDLFNSNDKSGNKQFTKKSTSQTSSFLDTIDGKHKKLTTNSLNSFTYLDMKNVPKSKLDIIYNEPLYKTAILHENISNNEKAKKLSDYHTKIAKARSLQARKKLNFASPARPILSSSNCNKSLRKSDSETNGDNDIETNNNFMDVQTDKSQKDLYTTSRSGRTILKRTYFEDSDSENSMQPLPPKKLKNISDSLKITSVEDLYEDDPEFEKKPKIKKSNWLQTAEKKSRTDMLLERAAIVQQEKDKQDKVQDEFDRLLSVDDEDEIFFSSLKQTTKVKSKEEFQPKRVSPPIPIKPKRTYGRRRPLFEDPYKADKGKGKSSKTKNVKHSCPICGKSFSGPDIQAHASTCGDFVDDEIVINKTKCSACGKVYNQDDSIEHAKNCE